MAALPQLIVVSDDLTGAADVAGPFASRGLRTWVVAYVEGCAAQQLAHADVVSVNAETRQLSAGQARERVRALVREQIHPDSEILIKKIDSTLRGHAVAETLAMLEASGRTIAVVAPAFPRQGRTLANGVVHVHGVPLKDTSFARDALSPPPLEPLHVLFGRADAHADVRLVGQGASMALTPGARRQIFVVDGASDDELRATVGALRGHFRELLLVGSAGIAEALAADRFHGTPGRAAPPLVTGPLLFVVGSRAQASVQQASALVETGSARIVSAPDGLVDVDAAVRACEPMLVLEATAVDGPSTADATEVAQRLSEGVVALLARKPFAALVATGGDTAVAILRRLAQPAFQVMGNLLPGIPFGRIRAGAREIWFVTKAGGFGARDAFVAIAQRLRGSV